MISCKIIPYKKDGSFGKVIAELESSNQSPISLAFNGKTINQSQDGFMLIDTKDGVYSLPYEIHNKMDVGIVKIYHA